MVERVETPNPRRPHWYATLRDEAGCIVSSHRARSAKHAQQMIDRAEWMAATREPRR
jgi:hypothetical protein